MLIFRFLDFELDVELYELRRSGERLPAERRALDLLLYFVRNRDRVISREEFLEGVWPDVTVRERIVDQMIYTARKLLEDDANAPEIIETIRGRGWRFLAEVVESALRRWPQGSLPPGEIPFVGRKKELEALEGAMEAGRDARGSLVLITGEPGIGKSRLIDEFADRASRQGARAYIGRCPEVDGAPPFWPWTQLLRAHRLAIGEIAWEAILERSPQVGQLSRELDETERWRTRVRPSHVGNDRFVLYDTIARFWLEVAKASPVLLLFLDDLHRADESSLQLLRFLAEEVRGTSVVVVGTSRGQLGGSAATGLTGVRMNLGGLQDSEVVEFVEQATRDTPASANLVDPSSAGGNPFLLKAMLRTISVSGENYLLDRDLVLEFTSRFPLRTQLALIASSVVGLRFPASLVGEVCGIAPSEIHEVLEPAVSAGVLHRLSNREMQFSHVLLRDSIYEALPESTTASLHSRVGHALYAKEMAEPAVLAHHFSHSYSQGDLELAFQFMVGAGRAELGRLALDEAHGHLRQARELAEDVTVSDEDLLELEILLGEVEVRCGRRSEGGIRLMGAAGSAHAAKRRSSLARAALAVTPGALAIDIGVVDQTAIRVLETALGSDGDLDAWTLGRLRARLALALHAVPETYETRRRLLCIETESTDSEHSEVEVEIARTAALWGPSDCDARRESLRRITTKARRAEGELEGIARILELTTVQELGHGSEARILLGELVDLISTSSLRTLGWFAFLYRASSAIDDGELDKAERILEVMREIAGQGGGANADNAYAAGRFGLHWHRGEFEHASVVCQGASERYPRIHVWKCGRGLALARSGRAAEAEAVFDQSYEVLAGRRTKDLMWLSGMAALADLCADLGRKDCANQICRELEPYSGRTAVVGYAVLTWGPVDRLLGRLRSLGGDQVGAFAAFRSAEKTIATGMMPIWATYNQLDLADALLRTRLVEDARLAQVVAQRGRALARAQGQAALVVRADVLVGRVSDLIGG